MMDDRFKDAPLDRLSHARRSAWRRECRQRFGTLPDFPVVRSIYDEIRRLDRGGRILDVGAGAERPLERALNAAGRCFCLDNDPQARCDYRHFDEIPASKDFDLVVMSQFIEHLPLSEAWTFIGQARSVMRADAVLVVGVPNAHHPVRYHADVTHITNWPFNDLYAFLRAADFSVTALLRTNKHPLTRHPLKAWLIRTVCHELRIDWCDSLIVTARPEA